MRKFTLVSLLCAALAVAFVMPSFAAPKCPSGGMAIHKPAGLKLTKAEVKFNHDQHKALDCKTCHHKWDGKAEKVGGCADAGCHDNITSKKPGENSYYNAYHDMKSQHSCIGCHKTTKAGGKKSGPANCNECHPGAEKS